MTTLTEGNTTEEESPLSLKSSLILFEIIEYELLFEFKYEASHV